MRLKVLIEGWISPLVIFRGYTCVYSGLKLQQCQSVKHVLVLEDLSHMGYWHQLSPIIYLTPIYRMITTS